MRIPDLRSPDLRGPDLRGYVSLLRDYQFWLALRAAPICWYAMHRLGFPHRTAQLPLLTVLMVVFVSPVLEEIVFRGGLQGWLLSHQRMRSSIAGISVANVISSVLFSALRLLRQSILWSALIFFPSLVFGWARDRHQNLLSPILLHMAYNAGFIWFFA